MHGADPQLISARRVLLDALDALGEHKNAVVVIGAQAIYLQLSSPQIAVAEMTTDADFGINRALLSPDPPLDELLEAAGFTRSEDPAQIGVWLSAEALQLDLHVPAIQGANWRRTARIPPHRDGTMRSTTGIEGILLDSEMRVVSALDPGDARQHAVRVAGPAALLIAKCWKLWERQDSPGRLHDKDAFDVFRILEGVAMDRLAGTLAVLRADTLAGEGTEQGLAYFDSLFASSPSAPGCTMLARATEGLEDPAVMAARAHALARELMTLLRAQE